MDPIGTAERLPSVAKGLGAMLGDVAEVEGLLLLVILALLVAIVYLFRRLQAVQDRLVEKLDKVEKLSEAVTRTAATQGHASDRMVTVSDRVAEAIMVLSEYQEAARRRAHGREDAAGGDPYFLLPPEDRGEVEGRGRQDRLRKAGDPDR